MLFSTGFLFALLVLIMARRDKTMSPSLLLSVVSDVHFQRNTTRDRTELTSLRLSKVSVNNFAGNVVLYIAGNERKFRPLIIAIPKHAQAESRPQMVTTVEAEQTGEHQAG